LKKKYKTLNRIRVPLPDHEVLQLHRNTRPELYKKSIKKLIRNSLPLNELSRYPDIDSFLIKLSKFINIKSDNIMITSGIDNAIKIIFESFDISYATILSPTYKMYEIYAKMYEVTLTKIQSRQDLTIDINKIKEIIPKTDILFIPNPHEPVENVFSRKEISEIVKIALWHDVLVVIDEAYFLFGAPTMIDMATKKSNLLVMRSFSKGFGLPAIRLGYTVGNKKLISYLSSRRLAYETNSLSIAIAGWAIDNFRYFNEYIQEVINTRTFIKNSLLKKGFEVHGSYSNTILINMSSPKRAMSISEELKDENIWVRELTAFPNINTWISVTIGNELTASKFLTKFYSIIEEKL